MRKIAHDFIQHEPLELGFLILVLAGLVWAAFFGFQPKSKFNGTWNHYCCPLLLSHSGCHTEGGPLKTKVYWIKPFLLFKSNQNDNSLIQEQLSVASKHSGWEGCSNLLSILGSWVGSPPIHAFLWLDWDDDINRHLNELLFGYAWCYWRHSIMIE